MAKTEQDFSEDEFSRFPEGRAMEDLEVLWTKLSFLSTKNQLKWNGSKNDLLRFLALHLEVQPNQFRASDNGTCAVFKIKISLVTSTTKRKLYKFKENKMQTN